MTNYTPSQRAKGYVVDNLGRPAWLVTKLKKEYPAKSIHYAIQTVLKQNLTK